MSYNFEYSPKNELLGIFETEEKAGEYNKKHARMHGDVDVEENYDVLEYTLK